MQFLLQRKYNVSTLQRLIMFEGIIAVYSENHTQAISRPTLCSQMQSYCLLKQVVQLDFEGSLHGVRIQSFFQGRGGLKCKKKN
jgi:hypothetical protein